MVTDCAADDNFITDFDFIETEIGTFQPDSNSCGVDKNLIRLADIDSFCVTSNNMNIVFLGGLRDAVQNPFEDFKFQSGFNYKR